MKAAVFDFVFEKGTDWNFNIGYNTGLPGSYCPVNVSGFSAEFRLYKNRYSNPVLIYTSIEDIEITTAEGRFSFTIPKAVNELYQERELFYTFELTDTAFKTERILKGSIKIEV